ncbi:hypothetical protein EVAR_13442_1 [Eumeta japonica]|uniref:Uncharacterized protein n=1 Tax=Eumeta variegata TaxID=151549 RepID=A0A4C1V677_EUMVA|nr:hypothetical protein EVAR_13442_1 [Eumeta japonica]
MENNPDRFSVIARSRKQVARPHASRARCDPPISARRSPSSRHLAPINAQDLCPKGVNGTLLQSNARNSVALNCLRMMHCASATLSDPSFSTPTFLLSVNETLFVTNYTAANNHALYCTKPPLMVEEKTDRRATTESLSPIDTRNHQFVAGLFDWNKISNTGDQVDGTGKERSGPPELSLTG